MRLKGRNARARVLGTFADPGPATKTHDPCGRPRVLPIAEPGEPGFVYFIQVAEAGPIKIGWTTSPQERIDTLQTASPFELKVLAVLEGSKKDEAAFHRQFADVRLQGEWFKDCDAIHEAIASRVVASRRSHVHHGEHCQNCRTRLVVDEDLLCKACVEFMDCWATPEFKRLWQESQAA